MYVNVLALPIESGKTSHLDFVPIAEHGVDCDELRGEMVLYSEGGSKKSLRIPTALDH